MENAMTNMTAHKITFANWSGKSALEIEADTFALAVSSAKADLSGANLRRANLHGADLSGAAFADGWVIAKAIGDA
jgi:uncharacterized protein YjbI with pentapeptide repeats